MLLILPYDSGASMNIARRHTALAAPFVIAGLTAAALPTTAALADAIQTDAQHAYIVDFQTGAVILDKGSDERIPPASTSKLMTIYLLFDALKRGDVKLTDKFHVSKKAWATQGSKMFVEINS